MVEQLDSNELQETLEVLRDRLDSVYTERNLVVALALKLAQLNDIPVWMRNDEYGCVGPEWKNVVFMKLPDGTQVSWHIHANELPNFIFLPREGEEWDGHDTETKYEKIRRYVGNKD